MIRRVLTRAAAALTVAATLTAAGCSGGAGDRLVIGLTAPLSGGAAQYGKNVQRGIQMAVDEINEAGGLSVGGETYQLELVALDDRYRPSEAATNARRLAQQYHAPVVMCPHSGGILAIQEFNASEDPTFLLGAYSSEPAILEQSNPLTVMIPPSFDQFFEPFARRMLKEHGERLGLVPASHAYARRWTEGFTATWEKMGGSVLSNNAVDYTTTTDFSGVVAKALSENPNVLFVGGPSQPTALVIEAARQQGFDGGFVVMDQAKFSQIDNIIPAGMLDGSVGIMPLVEYPREQSKKFVARYRERIGDPEAEPSSEIGLNYQAVHILARAMELADSARNVHAVRNRIAIAARTLAEKYAPYPLYGIDRLGHMQGETIAAYIDNGEYEAIPIDTGTDSGTGGMSGN